MTKFAIDLTLLDNSHMPIITIGGGSTKETLKIDKEIVRLAKKARPSLLFIPTASGDSEKYWWSINKQFGKLGCKTDVLFLIREKPSHKEIKKKIMGADIIYTGGGNTLKMMRLWRRLGVDKMLKCAWKNGKVLCGLSAGSICWYESGHSDSMSFYNPKKWDYINVRGLGFLKGVHCPHYNGRTLGIARRESFKKMMAKIGGTGFAVDNGCALVFEGEKMRVIGNGAYRVFKKKSKVVEEEIHNKKVIIFDLDGLLVDSQPLQYKAYNQVFSKYGFPLSLSDWHEWIHKSLNPENWIQKNKLPLDAEKIRAEKKIIYDKLMLDELELKQGARNLIENLHGKFKLCVASSSRLESIKSVLNKFNLESKFEKIISDTETAKGKPFPDIFLQTAKLMNVKAWECVVIEDSIAGLKAAKAAGMACIICPDKFADTKPVKFTGADKVVNSLDEVTSAINML